MENFGEISIGFDRQKQRYIAYSVENNIFAIGITVDIACDNYRKAYYQALEDTSQEEYKESLREKGE